MDVAAYFESVTAEMAALKNRVRQIIGEAHWQTDGEWKETVLRNLLRRHLPATVGVGRGFVVSAIGCSPQVDILLFDTAKPTLYRDGDLVLVTPDAVLGLIEVKTRITSSNIHSSMKKLADLLEFVRKASLDARREYYHATLKTPWERSDYGLLRTTGTSAVQVFGGLFAYDTTYTQTTAKAIGRQLINVCKQQELRTIEFVSLGSSLFTRWWGTSPDGQQLYDCWHTYDLLNKAPGYLVNNLLGKVVPDSVVANERLWFPEHGKEPFILDICHANFVREGLFKS